MLAREGVEVLRRGIARETTDRILYVGRLRYSMEIVDPIWCLKTPRCPCCDEQGTLCFSTCPRCAHIILVCNEVGTVFPNPKDLAQAGGGDNDATSSSCPNCGKVAVSGFRHSTSEEIKRLGFRVGEYE